MIEVLDYYPFGSVRLDEGDYDNNYKYTGHEYDDESGLYYMKARYQDPSIGRFVSQDPVYLAVGNEQELKEKTGMTLQRYLENPQHLNSYSYTINNPIKLVDTEGEWFKEFFTGQQSWSSFQLELGEAAQILYDTSAVGQTVMEHPYASGAVIGAGSGLIAYGASAGITYGLAEIGIIGSTAGTQADKAVRILNNATDKLLNNGQRQSIVDAIQNTKLQNIFNSLYKASDKLPGGTSGAIKYTTETGNLVRGSDHIQKGVDSLRGLQNIIQNANLSSQDQAIAQSLVNQLTNALSKAIK